MPVPILPLIGAVLIPQLGVTDVFSTSVYNSSPASAYSTGELVLGSGDTEARIVAAGNIDGPVYRDQAWINNRGKGYDGVVSLQLNRTDGTFICSGALLNGGRSILTAAHCLANSSGAAVTNSVDINFFPGPNGNTSQVVYHSTSYHIKAGYGGHGAIDKNDLAIVDLAMEAPLGVDRYDIYHGSAVNSSKYLLNVFDVVGFGARGSSGVGATMSPSFTSRRHGFNTFDFDMGSFYGATYAGIYIADFDNGTGTNDANCFWFGICNRGVANEANTAGGDSGGPAFITVNGKMFIAGVTSFGWRPAAPGYPGNPPDIDGALNSSFGELSGWVAADRGFAAPYMAAPEPSSIVLMASGLVTLAGAAIKRRRA